MKEPSRITKDEAKKRLDSGQPVTFVDARSPAAWAESDEKIPGAIRIPADDVEQHLGELPKGHLIVTYCT